MAEESFQEKTEAPTDKRRADTRKKGSVAKSTEINSVLILLCSLVVLRIMGPYMFDRLGQTYRFYFGLTANPTLTMNDVIFYVKDSFFLLGAVVLPFMLVLAVVGVLANYIQVGWLFTFQPLVPKLEKLNPISGMGRLFALRSLVELAKNVAKPILIAAIAYVSIREEYGRIIALADAGVGAIWVFTVMTSYKVVMRIALALIILAILDYAYQRWEYEKNLKMTKEEVKEERKQMEGDPAVKSRVRSIQREMARRRMMREVPRATVVVTNPTYLALAIRYEPSEMETPKIIAKGKRLMAQRIKDLARENGIPIVEDKPLARAMYDKVEPGDDIPVEFFTAVAEILAYVYRLKGRMAA